MTGTDAGDWDPRLALEEACPPGGSRLCPAGLHAQVQRVWDGEVGIQAVPRDQEEVGREEAAQGGQGRVASGPA